MQKRMKLGIGIVCAIAVVVVILLIKNFSPLLFMNPLETGYVADTNILSFKNGMGSLYFIEVDDEYILIDAGTDREEVEKLLIEYEIDPRQIRYVFLTHSDSDHVASLGLYENAEIYMSEDEVALLDGTSRRQFIFRNALPSGVKLEDITLLLDSQEVQIGAHTIQAVKTPGHTLGSMTFILDAKYMFTGDAFSLEKGEFKVHPFSMDAKESLESIEKIRQLYKEGMMIFTTHYGMDAR